MIMQTLTGRVTNNEDPAKAGRIKVALAIVDGDEYPEWIEPIWPTGWAWVPEVGDEVEIVAPEDEDLIEFSDLIRYRGIVLDQDHPVPDAFQESPKMRGFKTKAGHVFLVDDRSGQEEITFTHKNRMQVSITNDGIYHGSQDAKEPVVLGLTFITLLEGILDAIVAHTHPTGTGPSGPPVNASSFTNLKTTVTNKDQVSDFIFAQKAKPS